MLRLALFCLSWNEGLHNLSNQNSVRRHIVAQYIDDEKPAGGRFCQSISALQSYFLYSCSPWQVCGSSPPMVSSCLIKIPMKFLQALLPRQSQPDSYFYNDNAPSKIDSGTTSVTLLTRTCSMKTHPVLPLHRKHGHLKASRHSKRSLTVWRFDHHKFESTWRTSSDNETFSHMSKNCPSCVQKVLLCQLIRLNFKKKL